MNENCGVVPRQVSGRLKLAFDIDNLPRNLANVDQVICWLAHRCECFGGGDQFLSVTYKVIELLDGIDLSHLLIKYRLSLPERGLLDPVANEVELEVVDDQAIWPALVCIGLNEAFFLFHVGKEK